MEAVVDIRDLLQSWMFDSSGIIIESDNVNVITFLQDSLKKVDWHLDNWPAKELHFLSDFNKVIFHHVNRECNKVADFCATLALDGSFIFDSFSFSNIPNSLIELIKGEMLPF
ncbi:hypothetical protein KFK09_000448 [Dendrobium nobile]|uniref:RNase H type-1 domain-containing protein n=1 Tax=Dendrobium nobile TaxID=94219 RepID=A0A8T3CEU1_DENNO|nr:hypothetical protein KFK09_000448 [Dendrobium nobile]